MQDFNLHNDTESVGKVRLLLSERYVDILSADETVYRFFGVAEHDNCALSRILRIEKYKKEIEDISVTQNELARIIKNSFGYFDAFFTIVKKDDEKTAVELSLFKSRKADTVLFAASISADAIFRYDIKSKKMYLYINRQGDFSFVGCVNDFIDFFKKRNIVHKDDLELFDRIGKDISEGRNSAECRIRLSDGNSGNFFLYSIKIQFVISGNEETVMGVLVNIDKNAGFDNVSALDNNRFDFEKELTDFAFDAAERSADADEAIRLTLTRIAKHFASDRAYITERGQKPHSLSVSYASFFGNEYPIEENSRNTDVISWNTMLSMFDFNGTVSFENGNDRNIPEILRNFSKGAKSVIYCALYENGRFNGFLCCEHFKENKRFSFSDVSEIKKAGKLISSYLLRLRDFQTAGRTIDRLTNYDRLTGMPNINKFKRISQEILEMEETPENLSLIYYDFDNFKYINEKYGEFEGDNILRAFGSAITPNKKETIFSCREFSDKFISLVRCEKSELEAKALSVINDFIYEQRIRYPGLKITFSCGLYTFSDRNEDIGAAIDNITLAARSGQNITDTTIVAYSENMRNDIKRELETLNNAMQGLIDREFVVYYQPKIALETSQLVGGEALVRWKRADGTMIPPNDFIPCLEKNGFITALDFYVYEEVCRFIKGRIDNDQPIVPISVNVSMLHLKEEGFIERIQSLVSSYEIPPNLLEFELTESVFLENQKEALNVMQKMKDMGFTVSIDDFGSGFSSLNLLKSLPVDILKIDKEFFANHKLLNNDQIIISSIINMASRLNISVICEGVETEDQVDFLKENNCDMVQGYFYSKPVDEIAFGNFNFVTDFCENLQ